MNIIDNISGDTIEIGDQIIVDGDLIEVTHVADTSDPNEIVVSGYSHGTGDIETHSLYADEFYDIWAV